MVDKAAIALSAAACEMDYIVMAPVFYVLVREYLSEFHKSYLKLTPR